MQLEDRVREKDEWVSSSKKKYGRVFSELDVLLRALDRFFNVDNLPIAREDITNIINRNFYDELTAVYDVVLRVLTILEIVIPESRKNAYWFQKFAQAKFPTDQTRDAFRERLYRQETPEVGLYLLYDSFTNLKGVIAELLKSGTISYPCFTNIGQVIGKEIRENKFFNPFRKDVDLELNIVENRVISELVKSIDDIETRRQISLLYLYLFMFLRFLNHMDVTSERSVSLNSSMVIIILLRSEIGIFQNYIEQMSKRIPNEELKTLLKSISYQFRMETKRVFLQELKDITQKKSYPYFRGKMENSHGILKNLAEQSILQLSLFFKPTLHGEEIFESFTTKLQQSLKLREDICVLHRFLEFLEEKADVPEERERVFHSARNYMLYFESFTFRLLRYDDYHEFVSFFTDMFAFNDDDVLAEFKFKRFLEKIHYFKIFLETTLRHLDNRAELKERPIDNKRVQELVEQYL